MDTSQTRIHSLYAGLSRFSTWMGVALTCAWLFAALSYYISVRTGTDWFSRSGSLMGLVGAAATFRLLGRFQGELAIALKEGLATVDREIEVTLRPPRLYQYVSYFAYLTGCFGTAIWGYGDQLLRLAAGPHWGKGG